MAVIEFQIADSAFLEFLRVELNRRRLPARTIPVPQLQGRLLERIECTACAVSPTNQAGSGQVRIAATLVLHHTTPTDARAAGSLQAPITQQSPGQIELTLFIGGTGTPPTLGLQWSLSSVEIAGQRFPPLFSPGSIPFDIPAEIAAQSGSVNLGPGVIAIRLATRSDDSLGNPVLNRLSGDDWAQLVPGQVFGDLLAAQLAETLEAALDEDTVLDRAASGAWFPSFSGDAPLAIAAARVVAVDKCPLFDIDVPVDLQLVGTLQPTGPSLVTTIELRWEPDSTLCQIAGAVLFLPLAIVIHEIAEDDVATAILGRSVDPEGFHEIAQDDDSITFQQTSLLSTPSPRFVLTRSGVTNEGLVTAGRLELVHSKRALQGSADTPTSTLDVDCGGRTVSVVLRPPRAFLHDLGVGGPPALLPDGVVFDPADAWMVVSGTSNSWLDLAVTFADPTGGRLPAGTATSVWLHTDCGLRWIDLGTIPPPRPPPTPAEIAHSLNPCLAISDGWGMGMLNLDWLVDPPDFHHAIDPVREWTLLVEALPPDARLEFLALKADGIERLVGISSGKQNVVVQVITDADETLEIRTHGPMSSPVPTVSERWIVPWAEVELEEEPVAVAAVGGVIGIVGEDGRARVLDVGLDGELRAHLLDSAHTDGSMERLTTMLAREGERDRPAWAVTAPVDAHTVATFHAGVLLVGTAGPMMRL